MTNNKPRVLIDFDGDEGNAYFIIAKAINALSGQQQKVEQLSNDLKSAHSYDGVLRRISKYVSLIPSSAIGVELQRMLDEFNKK